MNLIKVILNHLPDIVKYNVRFSDILSVTFYYESTGANTMYAVLDISNVYHVDNDGGSFVEFP